jgi:non-canonical purine NTP pyrophosphatase (RdgB/HAM1 family)
MKLVLASHNSHKAREFERLLPGFEVEPYAGDLPEEIGVTFRDNAELKARHVHAAIDGAAWVLADDSGIAASALDGRPGVRSARFAGEHAGHYFLITKFALCRYRSQRGTHLDSLHYQIEAVAGQRLQF